MKQSAFRLQTESWAWVLIDIKQVSVHVSSDGLFSTCFFCPTSADGRARRVQDRERGLCRVRILLPTEQSPASISARFCVCMHLSLCLCTVSCEGSQPGSAGRPWAQVWKQFGLRKRKKSGNGQSEALDPFLLFPCLFCFCGGEVFGGGGLSCAGKQFKIIEEDKDTSPNDYPTLHSHSSPPLRARFFFNKTKEQLLNKTLRCTGRRAGTLGLQALH